MRVCERYFTMQKDKRFLRHMSPHFLVHFGDTFFATMGGQDCRVCFHYAIKV